LHYGANTSTWEKLIQANKIYTG